MNPIRTTCPYCGVGCGLLVGADGSIAGDPDHPANAGRLCAKAAALGETLGAGGRLLHPTIGGRRASWDEALDLVAAEFSRTLATHGADALAFYVSGQCLTEDYYVANKLMKGFIGSANIDSNSRLCMASAVAGHIRAFGEDVVPGCYSDLEEADLVVLVGSNLAWCHPVLYQRLAAARAARGSRVVVVDPRRTASCETADLHLALRPGSDVALFAGLLLHLVDSGACDPVRTNRIASGLPAAVAAARAAVGAPGEAARLTDLPHDRLGQFYEWFAATERTVTLYSQGVNQSSAGTDKVNAIINCHLATFRLGRPGTGPFSLTGQPNAMAGREIGGLATQLAAHIGLVDPSDRERVRRFWRAPRIAARPGLKAVELFDAVHEGVVRALWVLGTNPAASMPRAGRVRAALTRCPFVVVSDCWPTDTTGYADVVLPAAGWGEKDGTVTNSERRISRQRAFRAPPGEARPDWWMLAEIGRRMGWPAAFPYRRPAEIFREHAALSAFENDGPRRRVFDIGGLARLGDDDYDRLDPVQWPVTEAAAPSAKNARLFGDGGFPTADGRARLVPTAYRPLAESADATRPLLLNTGRVRDQWHTMTRTGRVPRLMAHRARPELEIHPVDAAALGLVDGGLARIESRHGTSVLPVRVATGQRPDEVFLPMHWTDAFASAGPIDRLVGAAADPISGQPELKATPVRVTALPTIWRGLLARRSGPTPPRGRYFWARTPAVPGDAFELAGWEPLPPGAELEAWAATLLGAPAEGDLVVYADPGRRTFRLALIAGERLDGALFLAAGDGALPSPAALAALFGNAIGAEARTGLLADASLPALPSADASDDPGPIVCACFAVGDGRLRRAIRAGRLTSVGEIGAALKAGTNCGSCLPEIRTILREVGQPSEASR